MRGGAWSDGLRSAKWLANSAQRDSEAASEPWQAKVRWTDLPVAGSLPTTMRIS